MGKRGPKPTSDHADKLELMSTRIRSSTRDALEKAAAKSGNTFSREVDLRLARSFAEEKTIVDHLGGLEMYAFLRMIAAAMNGAGERAMHYRLDKKLAGDFWMTDAYAYDQALRATLVILDRFRPPGDPSPPGFAQIISDPTIPPAILEQMNTLHHRLGEDAATEISDQVAAAESTSPNPKVRISREERLARQIAVDLGRVHEHAKKGKTT